MPDLTGPEGPRLSRRDFVKTLGAAATAPFIGSDRTPAETAVARFYASLDADQRAQICFPSDHPLRSQVANNWAIVKPTIGDLKPGQKALCEEVFKNLCSDDGHARFMRQMDEDSGGFQNYHAALFGEPGTDTSFEWVLTGRHATLRADGNRVAGAGFGGPIFYGHASQGVTENAKSVWWYQAEQAGAIFKSLDGEQKSRALVTRATRSRKPGDIGLSVGDLDGPQKALVQVLLKGLLRPFRAFDAEEIQECVRTPGGVDLLRLTYFEEGSVGHHGVWEIWKLEGPAFSWYYHGSPHVHAWLNVNRKSSEV